MTQQSLYPAQPKRLLVIAPEIAWPATHGGRVDIWYRYEGLKAEGWDISFLAWADTGEVSDADRQTLLTVFSEVTEIPLVRGTAATIGRMLRMARLPSLAALRHVGANGRAKILQRAAAFNPSAVISEGLLGSELACWLTKTLGVPLFVRQHNVEHKYMATQFHLARTPKQRLQIAAARLHLKRFEFDGLRSAWAVLDISEKDALFWREAGLKRVHWVPSFFPRLQTTPPNVGTWADRPYDVGYLGNLWTPNNVAAVNWFIADILPLLRASRPNVSVMIAGSNAAPEFATKISATPNVTYLPNPPDAGMARATARVLINPIREGSGINTKSVEMLYADSPVVVTSFAIAGMSEQASGAFEVANDSTGFAKAILKALKEPYVTNHDREVMRERFGRGGAQSMSQILLDEILAFEGQKPGAA